MTTVVGLVVNVVFAHVPAWLDQAGSDDDDDICVCVSVCVCVCV